MQHWPPFKARINIVTQYKALFGWDDEKADKWKMEGMKKWKDKKD